MSLKVLLYGGCHALVLRDCLTEAFGDRFECTLIINFLLIASGEPFPYETLASFDAVLFSPIVNRAGYETADLVEACGRRGIPALCFPWLEWHGYFPGAAKGQFLGHFRWHYPELVERAAAHRGDLDAFCSAVVADFPSDAVIDAVVAHSTAHVRAAEERGGMAPVLSAAIDRDFRDHRLFLVPDHPARRLYLELLVALLARLGIAEDEARGRLATLPLVEPHWRWRMPILPRVVRRLDLAFASDEWIDEDIHPGLTLSLRDYLAQYLDAAAGCPGGDDASGGEIGDGRRAAPDTADARKLMRAW